MTKKHAKLSASGSSAWLNCPGSVKAQEAYPKSSSVYADEGTIAHEIADYCLKTGNQASVYVGKTLQQLKIKSPSFDKSFVIPKDMGEYVQEYVHYVLSFMETKDAMLFSEEKVDFSHVVPEGFGTNDSAVLIPSQRMLHIFDLKYGKGVAVEAFENTQGQLYGVGFVNEIGFLDDFDRITIHICQPRLSLYTSWELSLEELRIFSKYASERAELALSKDAPRIPGEKQCQWCVAKGDCKALMKLTEELISSEFDNLDDDLNVPLNDEMKKKILDNKDLIFDFFNSIEKDVYVRLVKGEEFPGYKLVEGKSNRALFEKVTVKFVSVNNVNETLQFGLENGAYINLIPEECKINDSEKTVQIDVEKYLAHMLGQNAYKKKLIGVTDAEKQLSKDIVKIISHKPSGKLTLVKESDKRKAIILKEVVEEFSNLDEN